MTLRVRLSPLIQETVRHLPPEIKKRVRRSLVHIAENPAAGKPLVQELKGLWSYAVPPFRIVYEILESRKEIRVLSIEHRRTVYDRIREIIAGG